MAQNDGGDGLDDLLADPNASDPNAADPNAGDPNAADPNAADPNADPNAALDFSWATGVKAEAGEGEDTSNLDWLKGTKVKDLDSLVKIARDNQKALRESGRVKIPGADAKPEEVKAFREALGVPETAEGYELKLPDGLDGEKYEVDGKILNPLREVALEKNIPAEAFAALGEAFMRNQAEEAVAMATANNEARAAKLKEWGGAASAKATEFTRGARILGLDKQAVMKIQAGYGVGETMELLSKIGNMAGEDFFHDDGGAAERFGVASLEQAQKQLDDMINNKETAKKIRDGSDPALKAKYDRLIQAVSTFKAQAAKK